MGRHRKPRSWTPAPVPTPPKPAQVRTLHLTASGIIQGRYIGMCGQRSGFKMEAMMYESWREWKTETVAERIFRFVLMAREKSIWPDWMPPQEPIIRTYDLMRG